MGDETKRPKNTRRAPGRPLRRCGVWGWRSGNLWGPGGDGVRWCGRVWPGALARNAHFTATRTARRRLLLWAHEGYEQCSRRCNGDDQAIACANKCHARLRET